MKRINFLSFLTFMLIFTTSCSNNEQDLPEEEFNFNVNKISESINKNFDDLSKVLRVKEVSIFSNEGKTLAKDVFLKSNISSEYRTSSNQNEYYPKQIVNEMSKEANNEIQRVIKALAESENSTEAYEIIDNNINNILTSSYNTQNKKMILSHLIGFKSFTKFVENNQDIVYGNNFASRRSWWDHCSDAFGELTDDFVGKMAVAVFPGPCLIAVGIAGTYNYIKQ